MAQAEKRAEKAERHEEGNGIIEEALAEQRAGELRAYRV